MTARWPANDTEPTSCWDIDPPSAGSWPPFIHEPPALCREMLARIWPPEIPRARARGFQPFWGLRSAARYPDRPHARSGWTGRREFHER